MSGPLFASPPGARRVDLVGIGQNALDHVCDVDGLPSFAGKAPIRAYTRRPGGQVATAVLAAARLGRSALYLGKVGDDGDGQEALGPLRKAGVDVSGVRRVPGTATQMAVILVDHASGERTVLWHRDPDLALHPDDFDGDAIAQGRVLHLDGSDPEVGVWAARIAREAGMAVVLDADAPAPGIEKLLPLVHFPIVSHEFATTYFGTSQLREALAALAGMGAQLAAITLGEHGALAQQGGRVIESPAFPVRVRDTTGAGDAFHGGFIWALIEGHDAPTALLTANAVAAMNCRAPGAQGGLPDLRSLEDFLRDTRPGDWREPR